MMVAEFVARQQSASPVNGETAHSHNAAGNMTDSHGHSHSHSHSHIPVGYVHDGGSPGSPGSDSFSHQNGQYDMAAHLKRKELFSQRKQREFIPDNKKDDSYWDRRRRNNEAAKRSREKRRFNDMILEQRVVELSKENHVLKAQLDAIKDKYNICGESVISVDQVLATLPSNEQVLSITKRAKLSNAANGGGQQLLYPQSPSPAGPTHPNAAMGFQSTSPALSVINQSAYRGLESEQELFVTSPVAHYPYEAASSALNLSRRAPSPYEVSSGSGDEAHSMLAEPNNSLPLKLRHKSHLGDKDAASALLALQHIKQEPGARCSPPWDTEGSSDERDSGISLGGEWALRTRQRDQPSTLPPVIDADDDEGHLKSELARLASEVATLKSMINSNKPNVE
ncbi:uncharacterized protein LOC113376519 [Ctenocephalides felis]|uniref:uncharacterized protein LOC113376519 n=1 Tax=Ctenocephalides felis TaxID=7515 RepID=UPI000E6E5064|nr:uncharacterized protein LOC113376519 [Ctenocephalides felis]